MDLKNVDCSENEELGHHMDLQNVDCSENDELGHHLDLQNVRSAVKVRS